MSYFDIPLPPLGVEKEFRFMKNKRNMKFTIKWKDKFFEEKERDVAFFCKRIPMIDVEFDKLSSYPESRFLTRMHITVYTFTTVK